MTTPTYLATDPAVLLQLAGDRATFRALAQTFVGHAPPLFHQLTEAMRQGDLPAVCRHSHALKGMTTLVGAASLTALLQSLETAARAGRPADAGELAPLFAQVLAEVTACIDDEGLHA